MIRGLYIATTALRKDTKNMDVIANNLANVGTTGFKRDVLVGETFPEVFVSKIKDPSNLSSPVPFNGVRVTEDDRGYVLETRGAYFTVQTPQGISRSSSVRFSADEDGYLRTFSRETDRISNHSGNLVMGNRGSIFVGDEPFTVDARGNVISGGEILDNLLTFTSRDIIGSMNFGSRMDEIKINFSQGILMETGNAFDLAIKGEGFFVVHDGDKEIYTRDGSFSLTGDGQLVTKEGYSVLDINGNDIFIDSQYISIDDQGRIIADGEVLAELLMTDFEDKNSMRKIGFNTYTLDPANNITQRPFEGEIHQGYLEGSNVNPVREMVEMISALRSYEASQKVIRTIDESLGKVINEVGGRLGGA